MFEKPDDLTDFVHHYAKSLIGENGIIGTTIMLFEFIDEKGQNGYSMLRPPGTSWYDAMTVLDKGSEVLLDSYDKGKGYKSDDSTEDPF